MRTDNLDVSFCLPCYNVGPYIEDCIRSIMEQPFDGISFEIICVDDCSTDNTYDILVELSEKYHSIQVYKTKRTKVYLIHAIE